MVDLSYIDFLLCTIWHGNARSAITKIEDLLGYLLDHVESEDQHHKYAKAKAFQRLADDFYTYIKNNTFLIADYAERYRYGEPITTSFVESTVNYVISKRFVKKQSMQWTKRGAHLLLQVRTAVLNNEWEDVFRKQYPNFRIPKIENTEKLNQAA